MSKSGPGKQVADFSLPAAGGKPWSLKAQKGRKVKVDGHATDVLEAVKSL